MVGLQVQPRLSLPQKILYKGPSVRAWELAENGGGDASDGVHSKIHSKEFA